MKGAIGNTSMTSTDFNKGRRYERDLMRSLIESGKSSGCSGCKDDFGNLFPKTNPKDQNSLCTACVKVNKAIDLRLQAIDMWDSKGMTSNKYIE